MKPKLLPHQKKALELLRQREHFALLAKPGLGKTLIMLSMLSEVFSKGELDNVLVIAPRMVCELVWPQEIEKWGFNFEHAYMHGKDKDRLARRPAQVTFTTPDTFTRMVKEGYWKRKHSFPWQGLIVDESSFYKRVQTQRFKAIRAIYRRNNLRRTHAMTGTPAPNHLLELWPQIYIADQGRALGDNFYWYRSRFFHPAGYMGYSWEPHRDSEERIFRLLKERGSAVAFLNEDLKGLTPIHEVDVHVTLPSAAARAYREMEREFVAELKDGAVTAVNAAAKPGKLRQIALGLVYRKDGSASKVHNAKLEALYRLVQERQGQPLLLFHEYEHERDAILHALREFDVRVLEGRSKLATAKEWNAGRVEVLLLHPKSAGHGLNLQCDGADVCWLTSTWSQELYEQGNSRIHRQGQKTSVTVYRLIAQNTIDQLVVDRLADKEAQQMRLLNYLRARYA